MDRILEKKSWSASRLVLPVTAAAIVIALVYFVLERSGNSTLRVDPMRLTMAKVENGQFRDYYPFDGTVVPLTTVYLDVDEGGRVEEIFVEGGQRVEAGERILRFSNATLQRNSIDTETRLIENLNALRNTKLTLAQNALLLKDALLDLDHRILELEKTYERYETLGVSKSETVGVISEEVFERARDELAYLREKRELLLTRIEREEILSRQQIEQADESIERLNVSLELLNRIVDSLEVRAPISGFLSSIDAEVGQNINRGQRIGQIDLLDDYKISVSVDQYYISRVRLGARGRFELDSKTHPVVVEKIYQEVVNGAFTLDVIFAGPMPDGLRRGQRLTVELSFSEPSESLMVARGGFSQQGGGWVYLIAQDGRSASRAPIHLGRQNPRFVEVLEGLKAGDWIVSSGYETFNQVDELLFTQPIELVH